MSGRGGIFGRIAVAISSCAALAAPGCGGGGTAKPAVDSIRLGAYSVVREAFDEALIPAFQKAWKAKTGRDVEFATSYNASGAQARAIKAGDQVDVAALSLEGDMELLVDSKLVKPTWNQGPNKGIITNSLVVIGHREGNPKGLADWADLAKPGVGVLYPDPKTSGGAKWNVGAIYGSAYLKDKANTEAVRDLLAKVQKNVVNMDASGRQSVATFERGAGDALVTYENELLLRKKTGKPIPYVIPPSTLVIESPAAVVDANVDRHGNRAVAEAFLAFILSAEGQSLLADYGFRPIDAKGADKTGQPLPANAFRIADLGGWKAVNADVFGPKGVWTSVLLGK